MEKKMDNDMETGIILGLSSIGVKLGSWKRKWQEL